MTWEEFLRQSWMLPELLVSVLLGFVIGLERKFRSKEAGIRTHIVVCMGSALMMIISKFAFGGEADSSRVAAQIVAGVGFLGAGIIVYRKNVVHGLTTAAGVWTTAGIGMACGAGLYVVAVGASAIMLIVQSVLHMNYRIFLNKRFYSVKIEFIQTNDENLKIKEIFGTDRFNHLVLKREGDRVVYSATLNTDKEFSSTRLNEIISKNDFICSIERCEND